MIPCNTAHHYYADIASAVEIPILNLIDLVVERFARLAPQPNPIGVLASTATLQLDLYGRPMRVAGFECVYPTPERQSELMEFIRAVKAGAPTSHQEDAYRHAAADLEIQGAANLLIACTELSVTAALLGDQHAIVDAATLLAEAIVEEVKGVQKA